MPDAGCLQGFELRGDPVGRVVERAGFGPAGHARVGRDVRSVVVVGMLRERDHPRVGLRETLQRRVPIRSIAGDIDISGDSDVHRVERTATSFALIPE